jgi:NAD-dependent SIR2 family protein deacetylase
MTNKSLSGECLSCESTYSVAYMEEMVSQDLPEHCPFCGEQIEELSEDYIEDDEDDLDTKEWD